jgi:hypothetical protein
MVWILVLVMGGANAAGAIDKVAYYSSKEECMTAQSAVGQNGQPLSPRAPWAFCVPAAASSIIK